MGKFLAAKGGRPLATVQRCWVRRCDAATLAPWGKAAVPASSAFLASLVCSGSQRRLLGSGTACQALPMCGTFHHHRLSRTSPIRPSSPGRLRASFASQASFPYGAVCLGLDFAAELARHPAPATRKPSRTSDRRESRAPQDPKAPGPQGPGGVWPAAERGPGSPGRLDGTPLWSLMGSVRSAGSADPTRSPRPSR